MWLAQRCCCFLCSFCWQTLDIRTPVSQLDGALQEFEDTLADAALHLPAEVNLNFHSLLSCPAL